MPCVHQHKAQRWKDYSFFRFRQRCGDVGDGPEKNERIILGQKEAASPPEFGGFLIDGIDHQRPTANEGGGLDATLQGMFDEAGPNPLPRPSGIRRKLAEKKTGNRIGRLSGTDRARKDRRHGGGWRQPVVADDAPCFMNDENGGEAFLLIGKGARLQPMIEHRLAAREFGHVMRGCKQFGSR